MQTDHEVLRKRILELNLEHRDLDDVIAKLRESFAGVGQHDHDGTCIVVGVSSTNQAFINKPGDSAGHARA